MCPIVTHREKQEILDEFYLHILRFFVKVFELLCVFIVLSFSEVTFATTLLPQCLLTRLAESDLRLS